MEIDNCKKNLMKTDKEMHISFQITEATSKIFVDFLVIFSKAFTV